MRRKDRELDTVAAQDIIDRADYCVVSTVDRYGMPYAVPVNHVRIGERIYFHSAAVGRKNDAFLYSGRVYVTFVDQHTVVPSHFSTRYSSAIVHGKIEEIVDRTEKCDVLRKLCESLAPSEHEQFEKQIDSAIDRTAIWCITPEEITAKGNLKI